MKALTSILYANEGLLIDFSSPPFPWELEFFPETI
jgi:hypothetical protein